MDAHFEIEQRVNASLEEVFAHFIDAEKLVRWHGEAAHIDAKPGGRWWCRFEDGSVVRGEILEMEPPRRLVFTWGFETPSPNLDLGSKTALGASRVEVVLHPATNGGTLVQLRHTGFVEGDGVGVGWRHFLECLADLFKS